MRNTDSHIIRKTSVNFQITGNRDSLQLQQEITDWCRSGLNLAFDAALSEYDHEEQVIVIDSIKLDLELETVNWKKEIAGRITRQLREKIHSKLWQGGSEAKVNPPSLSFSEALLYFTLEFYAEN
jgi:hypothetical protein